MNLFHMKNQMMCSLQNLIPAKSQLLKRKTMDVQFDAEMEIVEDAYVVERTTQNVAPIANVVKIARIIKFKCVYSI